MTDQRFPEAETLSIKRLKVAIEKANWELLEKGLEKAEYLRKAGQAFKQTDLWQDLLLWAERENIPPNLWEKLKDFVDAISEVVISKRQEAVIAEDYTATAQSSVDKNVVIVYHQHYDQSVMTTVGKHRANLNNIIHNPGKSGFDPKWMDELSELAAELGEPQDDLKGFISLLSMFKGNSSIITNSYSANIHKMLVKAEMNVIYPGIKKPESDATDKIWEFFPLGGAINSFICTTCDNRIVKTEYYSKTLVENCGKCKGTMYPDIAPTGGHHSEIIPQAWYNAYERLINAKMWIIINPPFHNDQMQLRNLLLDAAQKSNVEDIRIITPKFEVYELWKSKFLNLAKNAHVKENYPSIVSLLETSANESVEGEKVSQ